MLSQISPGHQQLCHRQTHPRHALACDVGCGGHCLPALQCAQPVASPAYRRENVPPQNNPGKQEKCQGQTKGWEQEWGRQATSPSLRFSLSFVFTLCCRLRGRVHPVVTCLLAYDRCTILVSLSCLRGRLSVLLLAESHEAKNVQRWCPPSCWEPTRTRPRSPCLSCPRSRKGEMTERQVTVRSMSA